jgi:DNA-binding NtrC family response regulator
MNALLLALAGNEFRNDLIEEIVEEMKGESVDLARIIPYAESGAFDLLAKLPNYRELSNECGNRMGVSLQEWQRLATLAGETGMVASSLPMITTLLQTAQFCESARRNPDHFEPILIGGESGTGKELLAQFIHTVSGRREDGFSAVNCGGMESNFMDSELFGHEKGALSRT